MDSRMLCGLPMVPRRLDEFVCSWKSAAGLVSPPIGVVPYQHAAEAASRLASSIIRSPSQHHHLQQHAMQLMQQQQQQQQFARAGVPQNMTVNRSNDLQSTTKTNTRRERGLIPSPSSSTPSSACSTVDVVKATDQHQKRGPVPRSSNPFPANVAAALSADEVRRALFVAAFDFVNVRSSLTPSATAGPGRFGSTEHLERLVRHGLQTQQRVAAATVAALSYVHGDVINGSVGSLHTSGAVGHQGYGGDVMTSLKASALYMHNNVDISK